MGYVIDKSGICWKGEDDDDLSDFIASQGPASRVTTCRCLSCGEWVFTLKFDDEDGCAERRCVECGESAFIGDSEEFWSDAEPEDAVCPCALGVFEVCVGFSFRSDGEVQWISVGGLCTACGILTLFVGWSIDYSPTEHLLEAL